MLLPESVRDAFARIADHLSLSRRNQSAVRISSRAQSIRDSNIRDAARLVAQLGSQMPIVNLGQGLPEYPAPEIVKAAAAAAIDADDNQYSNTWGKPLLRQAIAHKLQHYNQIMADPDTEITVTCGASEALNAVLLSVVNPGDEVVVVEPFYENYHPNVAIAGGVPRYVRLHEPDWTFDEKELSRAFNRHTRAILINTPHNPTGRVLSRQELGAIAGLCQKWNALAVCDEIYEYMVYDGASQVSMASLPGMKERTFTVSGLSKTFSLTGWRLGYVCAPAEYTHALRKVHDYLTLAAPTPLQAAATVALSLPDDFYRELSSKYQCLRDQLMPAVASAGFTFRKPEGTYYLFADCSRLTDKSDRALWEYMLRELGLATVAGYCFYRPGVPTHRIRFCYAKYPATIEEASRRLGELRQRIASGVLI